MKVKTQKGITLIALIITIIVLMILAVVVINSVNKTGIINYAHNAVDEYSAGQTKENEAIAGYMEYLNKYGNQKKDDKPVSIAGKYGHYNTESTDYNYYVFNEDGTGEYIYYGSSPDGERKENITYTLDEYGNGLLNNDESFEFKVIRSNDGTVDNKMLYLEKISGTVAGNTMEGYNQIWTTKGINGLEQKENKTYSNVVDGNAISYSFENGTIIGSFEDRDTGPYTETMCTSYFIIEYDEGIEAVYAQIDRGCYELSFIILDDTYIIEMYGS